MSSSYSSQSNFNSTPPSIPGLTFSSYGESSDATSTSINSSPDQLNKAATRPIKPALSRKKRIKITTACTNCREHKYGCDEGEICARCSRTGKECVRAQPGGLPILYDSTIPKQALPPLPYSGQGRERTNVNGTGISHPLPHAPQRNQHAPDSSNQSYDAGWIPFAEIPKAALGKYTAPPSSAGTPAIITSKFK